MREFPPRIAGSIIDYRSAPFIYGRASIFQKEAFGAY